MTETNERYARWQMHEIHPGCTHGSPCPLHVKLSDLSDGFAKTPTMEKLVYVIEVLCRRLISVEEEAERDW